jgi:hypothetical protein
LQRAAIACSVAIGSLNNSVKAITVELWVKYRVDQGLIHERQMEFAISIDNGYRSLDDILLPHIRLGSGWM